MNGRTKRIIGTAAALGAAAGGMVVGGPVGASSHREAPTTSQDPTTDNTDLYAFRDPVDPSLLTVIANYIPFELPQGGPNFHRFGDDVLYEIHVDNDGDVVPDLTFQFRFRTIVGNPDTFLYNTGQVTSPTDPDLNVRQVYSVQRIDESGAATVLVHDAPVAPANVGVRSTPDYEATVAAPTVTDLAGGGRVFAGPRNDPFFIDIGPVFDLLGLRPLNPAHLLPRPATPGQDGLAGFNVHTIALQLPIGSLTTNGQVPTVTDARESFVGVYASASRQRVRVLSLAGGAPRNAGRWVQVSRLGIPLVNEVLIPLGSKDVWNATEPRHDAQFFGDILDPEPTRLLPMLYPGVTVPPGGFDEAGGIRRSDIVAVLTGQAAGLSAANALPPADLLRVNLAVPPTPVPDRLAVLAGDPGGFPNGRRLVDDVVDIELRLLAGGTPFTPEFNVFPNNAITDGVDRDDATFLPVFPYVGTPNDGYSQPQVGAPAP